MRQDARLAAAGPGEDQQRAVAVFHGALLRRVQTGEQRLRSGEICWSPTARQHRCGPGRPARALSRRPGSGRAR